MLCTKYQEAGICGSWEKCDSNYFVMQTMQDARQHKTTDSDPYMSPLHSAGDTISTIMYLLLHKFFS